MCRQEESEVDIRLFEVALSQQIKGLHDDLYDVGFSQSDEAGEGITAEAVWSDPLMVAVPARHPLLKHKRIPLEEMLRYPLVLCDPLACEGHARQVERVLRRADMEPLIAERVVSCNLMMALVSASFALGLTGAPHPARGQPFTHADDLPAPPRRRGFRSALPIHQTGASHRLARRSQARTAT
jgi:DNA-binding transcriptional LysR family regulator